MTDKTQPEALRLADALEYCDSSVARQAINELRRQHARIAELEAEIAAVGAGGVQALSAAPAAPIRAIETLMNQAMAQSVANGANSVSMPDEIVEVAYWLAYRASPTPPAEQQAQPGAVYAELPEPTTHQIAELKACEHGDAIVGWRVEPSRQSFHASMHPKRTLYTTEQARNFADRTHALRQQAAPKAAPGDEGKALAALRYYMNECSGAEPSISVFHRMVEEALGAAPQQEVSQDTMYLLRRLLSNQHTLTGPEFRAELEKIVGEAYQQEARPCHVFTVRKAGGLTEWEPTTMALALPDGVHALYTLPQPSPHAHADSVTAPMRQGKWTWVPVEPSTAMLVAGNHGRPGDFSALKVWEDMLGALDRSFDYTRPVDPPSTNPPAQAADRMLEDAALLLESQHTWLTNIAAANLVRSLAARARLGEKT